MSVVNTTYNFNQPNMNFGQALLYGAFGSLTGGMGCFGSGYGFGGYGMGMGGSLFSMPGIGLGGYGYGCGFGGYGMGCYSDSFMGMQVGASIVQSTLYCVSRALEGRGGNGNGKSTSSKLSEVISSAKKYFETLEISSISAFNETKKASEYTSVKSAASNVEKAESSINARLDAIPAEITQLECNPKYNKGVEPTSSNFPKQVDANGQEESAATYEARLTQAKKDYKEIKDKIDALKKEETQLKEKTDNSNKLVKAYNDAVSEKEAAEKAVNAAIEAMKPLKKEYDELIAQEKAETEAKVYDDADGNWLNRASKSSVQEYKGGSCTKSQVRKAFNLFIEAKNSGKTSDARNWANKIKLMHENNEDLFDNNFATAYDQVEDWLLNN